MEAANMGAHFAPFQDGALETARETLLGAPDYRSTGWLTSAWRARRESLAAGVRPGTSLGVPTWFYGHEPPNVWASQIAKLFDNSIREEGLLALASHGIIFAPGNAGTVQEIFQDGCQNYYRTCGHASPMILLGTSFWDPGAAKGKTRPKAKPVWPLLEALGREGGFREHVHLTDDPEEILRIIDAFRAPEAPRP
jgi:hypothetical protein